MKKLLIIGCMGLLTMGVTAQGDDNNLVQNPSFELSSKGKLKKLKQITVAEHWDSPTGMNADLFSSDKAAPVSTTNQFGKEDPMDGNRYAGIVAYSYNNKEPRTYLQTELLGSLRKGVTYCVKYHVSLSDLSKYAVNNLGVYVSRDPLEIEGKADIIFEKEKELNSIVKIPGNKVFNARYNWEPICNTFKASGKEKFIIIGNFYNNKDTKFEKVKKLTNFKGTQVPKAYYYIDQVEVFIIEDPEECDCSNKMNDNSDASMVYHNDFTSEEGYTVEEQIKLTTVYFDVLKTKIEVIMQKDLANLVSILEANPTYKLKLTGFTDQKELDAAMKDQNNEFIQNLANRRAKKIKKYLVEKGIDSSRLELVEQTEAESNNQGTTSLDQAKNRKVTFELVK